MKSCARSIEKKNNGVQAQYVVGMYSNLEMSAWEIRIWIMKQATCSDLYASSPLSFGDPKTDEGPLGLASVIRQERRSAGSNSKLNGRGGETASGFFIGSGNGNLF